MGKEIWIFPPKKEKFGLGTDLIIEYFYTLELHLYLYREENNSNFSAELLDSRMYQFNSPSVFLISVRQFTTFSWS